MSINNQLFIEQCQEYFKDDCERFLEKLEEPCSQAFFLNTRKADKEEILKLIDFDYKESPLTDQSFYHNCDNIGKTKAYELGLIYPQEIAASLSSLFIDGKDVRRIVDLCAAPGGKTINALNRTDKEVMCISNDVNHTRALTLSSNLERLGLDNVIITNKKTEELARQLEGFADLVILDAPCSGEGMIRKYPEILDEYSLNNIKQLSLTQSKLLDEAYRILNKEGQLLYSTCT
ncbi:MAG: RsmB/NOP family class I SAM-dependent RNA methyltransferase, partial [Erysipelotrichaceae bacterium]|nr:RsmB/NOP family class I SAM-dependent RNA methyltransferase [Erysipelotrichaceae bacterium]